MSASAASFPAMRTPVPGEASAKAPPFVLPGEHFTAALVFLLVGVGGVVLIADDLAAGAFLSSRVAAVTHLFTLGWITTSIMGALYQFLPVALGEPIRSVRLGHAAFVLYVPGLTAFVSGLAFAQATLMHLGAATFGTGIVLFTGNLAATLQRAKRRDLTWWALACADAFLATTLVLGLALAGNLSRGYLGDNRWNALGVHLHVALAGWVLLVMIGVAHRLLPMFLLSHGASERYAKLAVGLVASGAGMLAALHHAPALFSRWLPALLIAAGCAAFLLQARAYYAHRVRRALDPGMRLAAAALGVLAVGLILAWPVLMTQSSARLMTAYIVAVLLGISLFVAAHYYKNVPFLVWYHRFGPLSGKRPVPRVSELYSARAASVAGGALLLGAVGLIVSIGLGAAGAVRIAALVLALGAGLEAMQMLHLGRTRP